MTTPEAPKFGVKFPSRKERAVKLVTKCETRAIQKRLEPPKPIRVRPPPKPKPPVKPKPPATLVKPPKAPRFSLKAHRNSPNPPRTVTSKVSRPAVSNSARTLQQPDLEKLARLNCSREFGLFNQYIKSDLSKAYENQLAFLQTKLQHLKNEFVNKQAEHLNFEQIKEYYTQAVGENVRRKIKPDEYLTLAEKLREDVKQAIDKWLKKKELKPQRQIPEYLQRRQERIRERIKETVVEQKKQQQLAIEAENATNSSITISRATVDDDDIMIID